MEAEQASTGRSPYSARKYFLETTMPGLDCMAPFLDKIQLSFYFIYTKELNKQFLNAMSWILPEIFAFINSKPFASKIVLPKRNALNINVFSSSLFKVFRFMKALAFRHAFFKLVQLRQE